jgi:hypothetical protein
VTSSARSGPLAALGIVIASLAIAVPLANVRYSQLTQLVRILIRGLGIVVLILILTDSPLEVAWPAASGVSAQRPVFPLRRLDFDRQHHFRAVAA